MAPGALLEDGGDPSLHAVKLLQCHGYVAARELEPIRVHWLRIGNYRRLPRMFATEDAHGAHIFANSARTWGVDVSKPTQVSCPGSVGSVI